MLIPIGDDNRDRHRTPYFNYLFILINVLVFVGPQGCGENTDFTYAFATVPAEIVQGRDLVTDDRQVNDPASGQQFTVPGLQPTPVSVYLTLLTAVFMHGGIAHLLGNLLYLWVFGDNIEDRLGHVRYLLFYLLCGLLASLAHVAVSFYTDASMMIPSLGASGAISGVLGAYLLLLPRNRVYLLFIRFPIPAPAWVVIGFWFVFQVISGIGALGAGSQLGGVAYAAHVGGFVAGFALVKFFEPARARGRR